MCIFVPQTDTQMPKICHEKVNVCDACLLHVSRNITSENNSLLFGYFFCFFFRNRSKLIDLSIVSVCQLFIYWPKLSTLVVYVSWLFVPFLLVCSTNRSPYSLKLGRMFSYSSTYHKINGIGVIGLLIESREASNIILGSDSLNNLLFNVLLLLFSPFIIILQRNLRY